MSDYSLIEKGMALVPKFPATLSFCSSLFIVQHVCRNQNRRSLCYHRLLLGMSISDIIGSFGLFLSTWPIPKGEAYLAAGNVESCIAIGFINQSAILCTPCYNASLGIYYLLVIVRGWKEEKVGKVEKLLHAFPLLMGLGTGIAGIPLRLYNGTGHSCWIASGLPNHPENHNPNFQNFRLFFLYTNIWAIILFLAIIMTIIYLHVLKQEKKMDQYCKVRGLTKKRESSRKIRNQALLYVGCMYISWLFGSILRMMQYAGREPPPFLNIVFVFFLPLQGFFNLVVYMYPRREIIFQHLPALNCGTRCSRILVRLRLRGADDEVAMAEGLERGEVDETALLASESNECKQNSSDERFFENEYGGIDELASIAEM